ncbi:DUF1648 domain-containing protein [Hoyosella sp. YIM 151337]|uniref:DUF1648 domain-containing protein n=1 Tax=Hoyosella sp. YIM 151337 TaxID=2992742 RepID=UPI0022363350|nr:DUF1648 domain-containing protein [Hoyosella sp. YIM 151337]MCW4355276.1 DUF1648 domain-containing protein [Hoyosella sp. YIM 151337]
MSAKWQQSNPRWQAYLAAPSLAVAATLFLLVAWLPDLPSQIATQWSADGAATSSSSRFVMLVTYLVPVFTALLIPLVVGHYQAGDSALAQWGMRMAYGLGWFVAVFMSGMALTFTSAQRGAASALEASPPDWVWAGVSLAVAALSAVAGAALAPVTTSETRP